jgi:molybdate transport system substrate-binding protein
VQFRGVDAATAGELIVPCRGKLLQAGLAFLAAATFAVIALAADARQPATANSPVVAAASDLQFAIEEIAEAFSRETGHRVRLSFGSSGNFARQLRQGAPFELYLSADEDYVLDLARDGFTRDQGVLYAIGRIVLMTPHGSTLEPDGSLETLATALRQGRISRFAIANPEHAPYGKRAQEALQHKGLWEAVEPRLVLGENVSQAAQFAASGNAQGGIIAYSLALAPRVAALGNFELIPAGWHSPLRQRMVLLKDAGPVAESFYRYLQQPAARQILERYGFVLPGDPE